MKRFAFRVFSILFILLFIPDIHAQNTLPIELPPPPRQLKEFDCPELKSILEAELKKDHRIKQLIDNKKLAVGIVDLFDPNSIKFAGINEDHMMYAASLPKIAVLLAVENAIAKGEVEETPEIKKDLKLMISKSSNQAATRMIDLVGYEKIEAVLRLANHKLYNEEMGGGLWVGKRYAKSGKRHPDPVKGLSHGATAYQVASFYYLLATGQLVNRERSKEMLEIMKDPALTHKFVHTLKQIAPDATIYRKSGSWKYYHADSVLVWGPNRRYIMVALVENANGEVIIRNLVKPLEKVLFRAVTLQCSP